MIGSGVMAAGAGYLAVWRDRSTFVSVFIAPFFFLATLLVLTSVAQVWFFLDDRALALTLDDLMRANQRQKAVSIAVDALATIAIGYGLAAWTQRGWSATGGTTSRPTAALPLLAGIALAWALDTLIGGTFLKLRGLMQAPAWHVRDLVALLLIAGAGCIAAIVLVTAVQMPTRGVRILAGALLRQWQHRLVPAVVAFALGVLPASVVVAALAWVLFVWFPGGLLLDMARGGLEAGAIVSAIVVFVRILLQWLAAAFIGAAAMVALRGIAETGNDSASTPGRAID
ncbi:MAG: hypothetical protein KIT36_05710 [Alphaproteobacteria bacterium]|nr:hypothetical protein [Alphaproteobacteria bacterium]